MAEETNIAKPESLDIIYNLALARLDTQLTAADAVLARVTPVWSVAGLILGLAVGFLATLGAPIHTVGIIFSTLCAITFIAILVLGFIAYRHLGLQYPNVRAIWEQALFRNSDVTKRQILNIAIPAIQFNKELIERRKKYTIQALYLLPLEIALATIAIISAYFSG